MEYFNMKIPYPQLYKRVDMVASALLNYGIAPGEMVSVCVPNNPEFAYLFHAINKIGAVANMVGSQSRESANSKLLITLDVSADMVTTKRNEALVVRMKDKNLCLDWNIFLNHYGTRIDDVVLRQGTVFVVCNQNSDKDKEFFTSEVIALCNEQLWEFDMPVEVQFVKQLPFALVGKIDKTEKKHLLA